MQLFDTHKAGFLHYGDSRYVFHALALEWVLGVNSWQIPVGEAPEAFQALKQEGLISAQGDVTSDSFVIQFTLKGEEVIKNYDFFSFTEVKENFVALEEAIRRQKSFDLVQSNVLSQELLKEDNSLLEEFISLAKRVDVEEVSYASERGIMYSLRGQSPTDVADSLFSSTSAACLALNAVVKELHMTEEFDPLMVGVKSLNRNTRFYDASMNPVPVRFTAVIAQERVSFVNFILTKGPKSDQFREAE